MKKQRTALSVRTKRNAVRAKRNNRLNYKGLENRQLLAADLLSANALQVCEQPEISFVQVTEISARNTTVNVTRVIVGDGTDNRSTVENLTVEFDGIVDPNADSFSVSSRDTGDSVELIWTIDNSEGFSKVHISFSGPNTTGGDSLVDGNYELNVASELLGDSTATDFVFGDMEEDAFYRFFGDTSGDRSVDVRELLEFRNTYTESATDKGFDARFDGNGDDIVNIFDLLEFRRNFNESLDFVK